jgi:hypothetical protein
MNNIEFNEQELQFLTDILVQIDHNRLSKTSIKIISGILLKLKKFINFNHIK